MLFTKLLVLATAPLAFSAWSDPCRGSTNQGDTVDGSSPSSSPLY